MNGDDTMDFQAELKRRTEEIESVISTYLPKEEGLQKTVLEAMNYSVLAGGKRLRPMLMLETYRLFGGEGKIVEPFMAAIEMIHTYSLVHDDLPAMDNDEYRRGKKTTHAVYGEAMGILAGDGLLNLAFETAADALNTELSPTVAKAVQILSKKSGVYGMIGGQVVDIESEGKENDIDTLNFIHKMKTGALIECAMTIGAALAGASDSDISLTSQVALDIGVAFQIQDDILDATSTTEVLGKPVGSDEKNNKYTYVSLKGLDEASNDVQAYSNQALQILNSFQNKNEFLEELVKYLIFRKN